MPNPHILTSNWRVLPLTIADQQQHIEQSEKLLATVSPGDLPTLCWTIATPIALVLGLSQKHQVLNTQTLAAHPIPIYHRRAGGTAVLVGPHLLSLDVVLPADHPFVLPDIIESYRWLGEVWVATLAVLGIQARTVPPAEAHEQHTRLKQKETCEREAILHRACYGTLSPYEVIVGQRKIIGLDMIRRRTGSLLQAGVLLHWETQVLAQLLGHTPEEQALLRTGLLERAIGLDTLLGRPVAAAKIIGAFEQVMCSS